MRVYSRTVPVTATPLTEVLGSGILTQASAVGLQAPTANTSTIFFGDKNSQPFELRPEANALLPINSIKNVYVKGTAPDKISIGLF